MSNEKIILILAILLAVLSWLLLFGLQIVNFWVGLSGTTFVLLIIALQSGKIKILTILPSLKEILFGIILALGLYLIFFSGNIFIRHFLSQLTPFKTLESLISAVYAKRITINPLLLTMILIFPIGTGEEVFWRGYIQKNLMRWLGKDRGTILTLLIYSGIHLFSSNYLLFLAALICGAFWGILFRIGYSFPAIIISHILWDILIFVLFPLN